MTAVVRMVVLSIVLAMTPARGQEIYRCTGANGEVAYSSKPCGPNATVVPIRQLAPPITDATAAMKGQAEMAARGSISLREQQCLRAVDDDVRAPAAQRVRGYRTRIATLENGLRYAQNNQAGATWSAGLRQEIAALQQAIADEEVAAATLAQTGYQRCRDDRARAEEAMGQQD